MRTELNGTCSVAGTAGGMARKKTPPRMTKPSQNVIVQKAMTRAMSTPFRRQALYSR